MNQELKERLKNIKTHTVELGKELGGLVGDGAKSAAHSKTGQKVAEVATKGLLITAGLLALGAEKIIEGYKEVKKK